MEFLYSVQTLQAEIMELIRVMVFLIRDKTEKFSQTKNPESQVSGFLFFVLYICRDNLGVECLCGIQETSVRFRFSAQFDSVFWHQNKI